MLGKQSNLEWFQNKLGKVVAAICPLYDLPEVTGFEGQNSQKYTKKAVTSVL